MYSIDIRNFVVFVPEMDPITREKKVEGLKSVRDEALKMTSEGSDALEVRNFIDQAAKKIAYQYPDEEAFHKAAVATMAYKKSREV